MKSPSFAERLRQLRFCAGLSVTELAKRAGLQPTHVHQLENGTRRSPRLETLAALAKALGVRIDDLKP